MLKLGPKLELFGSRQAAEELTELQLELTEAGTTSICGCTTGAA